MFTLIKVFNNYSIYRNNLTGNYVKVNNQAMINNMELYYGVVR